MIPGSNSLEWNKFNPFPDVFSSTLATLFLPKIIHKAHRVIHPDIVFLILKAEKEFSLLSSWQSPFHNLPRLRRGGDRAKIDDMSGVPDRVHQP